MLGVKFCKIHVVSIALYRRYRPENFEEVIGQEHVTKPLTAALEAGRTTHAYLFSGPRGCGKTTSARILARCLNCAEYPTAVPCGKCESCVELSRGGSGSLDVAELDAASHGGVDDARELREQAGFAPVRDRFKIFIIDEAHMVTNQGFNALLKLVEEPPPHVKFIFATTEPEKVIGTIRSRTHHYPFRLVPPQILTDYLRSVCEKEGITAPNEVLSLVVRAGTGSVRDTLSVLDQIIGGSEGNTLDYNRAVALLGYTSADLLDEAVDALARSDGAAVFGVVEKIVNSGHDPRRFAEDLLRRLRDLVIIALADESVRNVFVSVPEDRYRIMTAQSQAVGAKLASGAADLVNEALGTMAGATAPRLQLELLCARLIMLSREQGAAGLRSAFPSAGGSFNTPVENAAKNSAGAAAALTAAKAATQNSVSAEESASSLSPRPERPAAAHTHPAAEETPAGETGENNILPPAENIPGSAGENGALPARKAPAAEKEESARQGQSRSAAQNGDYSLISGSWEKILEVAGKKSAAAAGLLKNAQGVAKYENGILSIAFGNAHWVKTFNRTIPVLDTVAFTVYEITGLKTRVQAVQVSSAAQDSPAGPDFPAGQTPPGAQIGGQHPKVPGRQRDNSQPASQAPQPENNFKFTPPPEEDTFFFTDIPDLPTVHFEPSVSTGSASSPETAKEQPRNFPPSRMPLNPGVVSPGEDPGQYNGETGVQPNREEEMESEWEEVSPDDPSISRSEYAGVNVVLKELDGTVIEEIPNKEGE